MRGELLVGFLVSATVAYVWEAHENKLLPQIRWTNQYLVSSRCSCRNHCFVNPDCRAVSMEPSSSASEDIKCVTSHNLAISSTELEDFDPLDVNRKAVTLLRTVKCPSNFHKISLGCVHASAHTLFHSEGEEYCGGLGATYYSAKSDQQLELLKSAVSAISGFPSTPWVNLNYQAASGEWLWGGTGLVQDTAQEHWRTNHPVSSNPCGYIRQADGYKLGSYGCGGKDHVVCFIEG